MFTPKADKLRHKILSILISQTPQDERQQIKADEIAITTKELAQKLKVSPDIIRQAATLLYSNDDIKFDDFGNGECAYVWVNAHSSFYNKKYIREGRKRINDSIYDVIKWALPIMLFIITLYTTWINYMISKDIKQKIFNLEQRLLISEKQKRQ